MRMLTIFIVGIFVGACTIGTFGGPKCATAYANRSFAVVCR